MEYSTLIFSVFYIFNIKVSFNFVIIYKMIYMNIIIVIQYYTIYISIMINDNLHKNFKHENMKD